MKYNINKSLTYFAACALFCLMSVGAAAQTCFRGGPYLQELSATGVTVVWENSKPTLSWVELRKAGTTTADSIFQDTLSLHMAYPEIKAPSMAVPVQNFVVRVKDLSPATQYEYRICSREIKALAAYSATFGSDYASDWYAFTTPAESPTEHSLLILSDMHNRPDTLSALLTAAGYEQADQIILAGDMMDNFQVGTTTIKSQEEPYGSFVNTCISLFAQKKDFYVLRGDHETMGDASRFFYQFFPTNNGKYYRAYRIGDLELVMLDGGAETADVADPTAGSRSSLAMFSPYREEEAEWLKQLVATPEFKSAKYRIVVSHFPLPAYGDEAEDSGTAHFAKLMTPILNDAGITLAISGHRMPASSEVRLAGNSGAEFPSVTIGADAALSVKIADGSISVSEVKKDGTTTALSIAQ